MYELIWMKAENPIAKIGKVASHKRVEVIKLLLSLK
jgi:hypothetical protein